MVVEEVQSHRHNSQHCSKVIHPGQPITFLHTRKKAARLREFLTWGYSCTDSEAGLVDVGQARVVFLTYKSLASGV